MVDAVDKHGRVWAWSCDDDFFCAVVDVRLTFVEVVEDAGGVDDVIDADRCPVELFNVSKTS